MAIPATLTASVGDKISAGNWNTYERDALNFLLSPPRCKVFNSTTYTIASSAVFTLLSWDSEVYDTDTMHSTVTNTSRLVATTAGLYSHTTSIFFAANATGQRAIEVRKNAAGSNSGGTLIVQSNSGAAATGAASMSVSTTTDVQMTAGDYLEVFVYQSSGGSLASIGGVEATFALMRWVASS